MTRLDVIVRLNFCARGLITRQLTLISLRGQQLIGEGQRNFSTILRLRNFSTSELSHTASIFR